MKVVPLSPYIEELVGVTLFISDALYNLILLPPRMTALGQKATWGWALWISTKRCLMAEQNFGYILR